MSAAVVGGQYGSEGKGLIVAHIARDYDTHVRVGAANAGHTFYTCHGWQAGDLDEPEDRWEKHVMQQLPCATYANPDAVLCIGPGAIISEDILDRELRERDAWRRAHGLPVDYVWIDERAHVVQEGHITQERYSGLAERIGSTSATAREGIGACQAARVMREPGCVLARDALDVDERILLGDVSYKLDKQNVLLEGSQGTSLSLTTGDFPYVTSRNTTVAGLCADAGYAASKVERRILVVRSYPIRVAGNSGGFYEDSREISWDVIGIDPETERTTVTKKIRRVATFSMEQLVDAVILNDPTEIALTFCDYLDPEIRNESGKRYHINAYPPVAAMVSVIEDAAHVPVTMLGTGPHSVIDLLEMGMT